ncbi:hypothetical protein QA640_40280 [Bradyrhizobium sp. CB82]|uniref:hypothetical protein n=1 Tax=Bradyrhizobium sp. CB82 TaxID=3039159 RepID=UPI0024B0AF0F|nr:hypothetical protein [Bradyrhizobium sp. CB82]WFU40350.1 hypothetical protein QA640_40280 [Bradyrhizobium sp. CB82]
MTQTGEPEQDSPLPYREVFAAALLPFFYDPNIHEFEGYESKPPFKRVKPKKETAEREKAGAETAEAEMPDWVGDFVAARDNIYKAQPAWRKVAQFSIEVTIEKFDLYKNPEKYPQFTIRNLRFQAIFSLFPGTGVGTIAFWLKIGSVQAHDALQAVDLFKLTDPAAGYGCLKVADESEPFEQVSELARFYRDKFKEVYPGLFTDPPEPLAANRYVRRWNQTYRQVSNRAAAFWAKFETAYPDLVLDLRGPARKTDRQDPSFSYPFLYVSSVANTNNASDLREGKRGREIVSINNRYWLFDQTVADFEVERAFEANLLQYDYGVILVSRASTVEIHAEMPFSKPEPGKTVKSSILGDLFQLMLLAEVPVMQLVFSAARESDTRKRS